MDSLKRIFKSAMDDRSPRFMLATIALGVVVALLAGTLIGYKLDDSGSGGGGGNTKKAAATAAARRRAAAERNRNRNRNRKAVAQPILIGSVVSARPAKIVVVGANNKRVPLLIGPRTKAEAATPSTAASIVVGSKVLVAPTSAGSTTAAEIVVLPSSSGLGSAVTAVTPNTSMTLSGSLVMKIQGAKVLLATASNRGRIPQGSKVAVAYFTQRRKNGAVEVAVLPATSKI